MKKLMIFCLLFITAFSLQAQTEMDEVTNEICDCIKEKDYNAMSSAEANQLVEDCVGQASIKHMAFFTDGIDENNINKENITETMHKKGEAIGLHAARTCPAFMELMRVIAGDESQSVEEEEVKETVLTGKFTSFSTKEFFAANLVETDGREHKLYWMEHFEGAMRLKENPKKNLNIAVEVSYKEVEAYNLKLQDYSAIKVITGIIWK